MNHKFLILGLLINGIGVTLDLFTTWIGINGFNLTETRILGNNPLIAYPVFLGCVALFYGLLKWFPPRLSSKPGSYRFIWYAVYIAVVSLPFVAVIHNVDILDNLDILNKS